MARLPGRALNDSEFRSNLGEKTRKWFSHSGCLLSRVYYAEVVKIDGGLVCKRVGVIRARSMMRPIEKNDLWSGRFTGLGLDPYVQTVWR